jgi:hypothetical protein
MSYPPPHAPEYAAQSYQPIVPPPAPAKNGIVTAGLVLGIVGIVLCWVPGLGFLVGVSAIIFSAIALSKAASKGKPITGLALGIVTVFVNAIVVAALGGSAASSTPAEASAETTSPAPAAATTAPAAPVATTPAAVATAKPEPVATTKAPAPAAPPPVAETEPPAKPAIDTSFGDGSYEVGVDVAPGKYKSSGATEGLFELCSVSTKNSAGDMVDWETANANEQVLITIKKGQTVEASGCEEFSKR